MTLILSPDGVDILREGLAGDLSRWGGNETSHILPREHRKGMSIVAYTVGSHAEIRVIIDPGALASDGTGRLLHITATINDIETEGAGINLICRLGWAVVTRIPVSVGVLT